MWKRIKMKPQINFVVGDITEQNVDAIVNAANESLLGGGGVDGAIHKAGGPSILEACKELRKTTYPDGLPIGQAVATTGGNLSAPWVIHTVGPRYTQHPDNPKQLAEAHSNSLKVADDLKVQSIAFPAISTGAFGYPIEEAAKVTMQTLAFSPTNVEKINLVFKDKKTKKAYESVYKRLKS